MLLTKLTELVVDQLNDKQSLWKEASSVVKAIPTLDWVGESMKDGLKILVVPELIQYDINAENSRERVKQLQKLKYISVLVGYTFDGRSGSDVAPWEETKMIVDIREKIEDLIITTDYSPQKLTVVEAESQPIDEQELDRRNFNAITSFGFEELQCGLQQELPSTQSNSLQDISEQGIRVSMRRRALSERRLGRK